METSKRLLLLIIFISFISFDSYNQSNTMYYMHGVPQSYYLNPATRPQCNLYLGFPGISPLQLNFGNSGFSPTDILYSNSRGDSVIHPLYSTSELDKFMNKLNKVEFISFDGAFNFASFGFSVGDLYFSFDGTVKAIERFSYPKDLIDLILTGNTNNQTFDFTSLNIEFLNYIEYGLNVSYQVNNQLRIGARPKLLNGLATLVTQGNDITIETATDEWHINTQVDAKLAVSGLNIAVDEDGIIDFENVEFDSTIIDDPGSNWNKVLKNKGFAIDLGAHYKFNELIEVSASLLDVGFIKWKNNTNVISQNGTYTFNGYVVDNSDTVEWQETLLDTLKESFKVTGTADPFTTPLHPKLFVAGHYNLMPGFDVGILSRTDFEKKKVSQDLVLLANWHPIKALSVSGSYSFLKKGHRAIGLGMGLKLGYGNLYYILDYIPLAYDVVISDGNEFPVPVGMYNFNFRFGLNLVFGCNKEKKLRKDKPLFQSTNWID